MNGPKFRLVSDGKRSYFEVCGKSMGKGISSVSYVHETGSNPEITISFDLNDFEFMEDGKVDRVTSTLISHVYEEDEAKKKCSPCQSVRQAFSEAVQQLGNS